jgi:hypothetical protein
MAASGAAIAAALVISCSSQGMIDENLEIEDSGSASTGQESTADADAVPASTVAKPRKPRASRADRLVDVPQMAIERNGAVLNAFYVVRGEGSWVDLAQRIYRDPVRAEDLKAWNPGIKISTGSVVFYRSPTRASDDLAMKPFHEDFGVAAESYSFQDGDTLEKIAAAKLGSKDSWREIQLANRDITDFGKVAPGTVIALPPAEVNNGQILEQIAQNQLEGQRQARQNAGVDPAAVAQQNPADPAQANVAGTAGTDESGSQRGPASEEGPVGRLMSAMQGLPVPPQVLAGALAILIGGAFLLRRRAE